MALLQVDDGGKVSLNFGLEAVPTVLDFFQLKVSLQLLNLPQSFATPYQSQSVLALFLEPHGIDSRAVAFFD